MLTSTLIKNMCKNSCVIWTILSLVGIQVLYHTFGPRSKLAYGEGISSPKFYQNGRKFEAEIQQHQSLPKLVNFTGPGGEFELDLFRNDVYQYVLNITQITKEECKLLLQSTLNDTETLKTLRLQQILKTQFTKNESFALIPPWLRVTYNDVTRSGLRLPVLTASDLGRLGNKMGEYATLFAIGKLYSVTTVIHPHMQKSLQDIFPHLSLPNVPEKENLKEWTMISYGSKKKCNYSPLELAASGLYGPKRFIATAYPFEIQLFNGFREEIKREFTFSDFIQREVIDFHSDIAQKRRMKADFLKNLTFIGFHIRRTDYIKHILRFGGSLPDRQFFQRALQYYRTKFDSVLFVASSDDNKFLKSTLQNEEDVIFVEGKDAATSMAILASCNHSIVTHGSYGFWSGYLAGGEVVYPDQKYSREYTFSKEFYQQAKLNYFTPIKQ